MARRAGRGLRRAGVDRALQARRALRRCARLRAVLRAGAASCATPAESPCTDGHREPSHEVPEAAEAERSRLVAVGLPVHARATRCFSSQNGRRLYTNRPGSRAVRELGERSVASPIFIKSAAARRGLSAGRRARGCVRRSIELRQVHGAQSTGGRAQARAREQDARTHAARQFLCDRRRQRRLVDLPGYGFARVPHEVRKRDGSLLETYLTTRRSLVRRHADGRHSPRAHGARRADAALARAAGAARGCAADEGRQAQPQARASRSEREVAAAVWRRGPCVTRFSARSARGSTRRRGWLDEWLKRRRVHIDCRYGRHWGW